VKVTRLVSMVAGLHLPLLATVTIQSMAPSLSQPQPLGTPVVWTVTATDSNTGPLTFQFSVAYNSGAFETTKDFNVGTLNSGVWTAPPFSWATIQSEGVYRIRVVAKDFSSHEFTSQTVTYRLSSRVTGSTAVVSPTANALVALYSAPACAVGSDMRVLFRQTGSATAPATTDWKPCNGTTSMNFYVAGMYPSTTYSMDYEVATGTSTTNGPTTASFTTQALPSSITFPAFSLAVPPESGTDTAQSVDIHSLISFTANQFLTVATDLSGNIIWYYESPDSVGTSVLTRPLSNETLLTIQTGSAWQSITTDKQLIHVIDLAGNTLQETNTGIIQQQLVNMGFTDAGSCTAVPTPVAVGAACLGSFHHEVQKMSNGLYVAFADVEKIFPIGTQGDTQGLPVDIIGDIYIVMDRNLQVKWAWETFQHDGGGTQLDINRGPILGETCPGGGCPPLFLLGPGIAPKAHDWLHSNSAYLWPTDHSLIVSMRHQDWVIKIDYQNGAGTGNILWRLGLDGDFVFNNINQDSWPWFSHQHDFGIENNGAGPATVFDDGNTRVSAAPLGLGCTPGTAGCNSRGMALTIDEGSMTVTPVMSQDLGVYAQALGSAQLLTNGDFFFLPGIVSGSTAYDQELQPLSGTVNGTIIDSLKGPTSYRSFRQADMYHPPIT